jgi:hypothetical protein
MEEPEPERRRQTKQPEAVPRTKGHIRIMTLLDAPFRFWRSKRRTKAISKTEEPPPIGNAAGIELVRGCRKPMT